jgi:short-subunit dehydrogenase
MAKTILITGASSGLGAEMARQFADRGYDLALCARRLERLEELRDKINADHPERRVEVRSLDVNDHDAVFEVFRGFRDTFGRIDRFVVNAGLGKGASLGTGKFYANKQTAETNFIGALAQVEAATEILREQGDGHLVMVSSVSALRGMPRSLTTYAATKAAVAHLAEGLRADLAGTPIKVTVLYPGYIESEMTARTESNKMLIVSTEKGVREMVGLIEKEKPSALVPQWPWVAVGTALKHLPLPLARKLM